MVLIRPSSSYRAFPKVSPSHRLIPTSNTIHQIRTLATPATAQVQGKKEGDISSVFVSLSTDGSSPVQLPSRFANIKRQLINGHEAKVTAGWERLLKRLSSEITTVKELGSDIIPQIEFKDISKAPQQFIDQVHKRGAAVIKGVIPEDEARQYKTDVEAYIKANPSTKAFPAHDPQVFELYWSPSQIRARSHPNLIEAQRFLLNLWHSTREDAKISTSHPLSYADRLRIRQPGDSGFALGPHIDGGSVERWEPTGYGMGRVYDKVWQGEWEKYDPWDASGRVDAVSDLYNGGGACSMFRMFQGWLSMSHTGPNEGTLMVNPLLPLATAYFLLRPFFTPFRQPEVQITGEYDAGYLDPANWKLKSGPEMTSDLQGASPGHAQELSAILHPHLQLESTMVHIPQVKPGDFVVWHCDSIHAVDKTHMGKSDSSVMYIPVCPVTEPNAEYLKRQREAFINGFPGPDFPGGKGESQHVGRPTERYLSQNLGREALQAMGFEKLGVLDHAMLAGEKAVVSRANEILGLRD